MERLGLGRVGYDRIAPGEGGLMSLTGSGPKDPQKLGTPICDLLAGMYGAYGIVAALHECASTGRGQVVRTSLLATAGGVHAFRGTRWKAAGEVGRAGGNHHAAIAPYGLFRCADGSVQIAVGSEGLFRHFCAGFAIDPELPGFATNPERVARRDEVIALVEKAFRPGKPPTFSSSRTRWGSPPAPSAPVPSTAPRRTSTHGTDVRSWVSDEPA